MPQVIVFANPEDPTRVAVMTPTGELPVAELIRRHIDTSRPYQVMDPSELPQGEVDGDFFEAWEMVPLAGGAGGAGGAPGGLPGRYQVRVNMERARNMQRDRLRRERKARLEALDVDFMRAVERGDTGAQQAIAAEKQALRDLPNHPLLAAADNTVGLRALTVDALVPRSRWNGV